MKKIPGNQKELEEWYEKKNKKNEKAANKDESLLMSDEELGGAESASDSESDGNLALFTSSDSSDSGEDTTDADEMDEKVFNK